jgi:hypothetical protein
MLNHQVNDMGSDEACSASYQNLHGEYGWAASEKGAGPRKISGPALARSSTGAS